MRPGGKLEQGFDLIRQQHGGRLVEHEQRRVAHQALDDLDALPLADRQVLDPGIGIERQAVFVRELSTCAAHSLRLQHAAGLAQHQVLDHGHVGHQAEMLVHHGDALRQRVGRALRVRCGTPPRVISPASGA